MSGAEPWIGSYRPKIPWAGRRSPMDAGGSMPKDPRRIDEAVLDDHGGEVRPHLLHDLAPEPRGGQHVGLVHARQATPAPAGQLEGDPHDAADLRLGVPQRVHADTPLGGASFLRRPPEIEAAGQLAHDQHVHAAQERRAQGRAWRQRRLDGHRAEIGEQLQPAAQGEERLRGTDGGFRVAPFRPADGTQEDRIGPGADRQVFVADGHPVGIDGPTANHDLAPLYGEPEALADGVEDAPAGGDDLRPDAIAGDDRDAVGRRGGRGHARTSRTTASRSLFSAERYPSSEASMMFVERPWPVWTGPSGPSLERRQRTMTWPCASSPAVTARISYSASTGCQPSTGPTAASTAPKRASTGPLPAPSAETLSPATVSETLPCERPPWLEVTLQPCRTTVSLVTGAASEASCSTIARRSASVTSFLASARAMTSR